MFCCNRVEYTLEEIKGGTSLGVQDMAEKPFYTFGRTPNNGELLLLDIVLLAQRHSTVSGCSREA